jgi:hypothetical protein
VVLPSHVTESEVDEQFTLPEQEIFWPEDEVKEQSTVAVHQLLTSVEKNNNPPKQMRVERYRVNMTASFRILSLAT